ncbi:MAG: hypothetical protein KIT76_07225 [Pseudolabrys sp.]|nr:hypothetical protein [Pseudolabrys sp.]
MTKKTNPPYDISCWLRKKLQYRVTRRQESDSPEVNASTFFAGKTGTIHKSSLLRRAGARLSLMLTAGRPAIRWFQCRRRGGTFHLFCNQFDRTVDERTVP